MCLKGPVNRSALAALAWLLALITAPGIAAADPVRLLIVTGNGQVVADALKQWEAVQGRNRLSVQVTREAPSPGDVSRADVVFVYYSQNYVVRQLAEPLAAAQQRGAKVMAAPRDSVEREWPFALDVSTSDAAARYWEYGGVDNISAFLAYAYHLGGGAAAVEVPSPQAALTHGIYHPAASKPFASLGEYLAWYRTSSRIKADAPLAGVTFYSNNIRFNDTAHIDALIASLEARGIGAVPIFGWPVSQMEAQFFENGRCPMGVLLSMNLTVYRSDDALFLERCGAHVINLVVTQESRQQWDGAMRGLPPERVSVLLNVPERNGASEPILVATTEVSTTGALVSAPVTDRVDMAAARAARWLALRQKPNRAKRVAILYYNNPPGRGNLGASYLQVGPTLATLLERLKQEGYFVGDSVPDDRVLLDLLQTNSRNIELWAPGELEAMVDTGTVALMPLSQYKGKFSRLPKPFRDQIVKEWGQPEQSTLMTVYRHGELQFVIPGLRFGNVFVGPQPLRSTFERAQDLAHDPLTPVPHSYVAAYLWYRERWEADAIVHIGRHGTLEWLPGKQIAQAGTDQSEVLLGDLPNPYLYIVDGGGEAIQAKRRGAAVMLSHLTPLIVSGGKRATFEALHRLLEQYERAEGGSPELRAEYEQQIRDEAVRLTLDRQLGFTFEQVSFRDAYERLHGFVHDSEEGPIPAGIHALGQLPSSDVQLDAIGEVLKYGFDDAQLSSVSGHLDEWAKAIVDGVAPIVGGPFAAELAAKIEATLHIAAEWRDRLHESAEREVAALPQVLSGRYLPTGPLGDPLRTPAALPTGRNLHAFDAAAIPTKAAWTLGRKMADQMIARYQRDHRKYPEKVSMVLWYGETEKHQGAMESMALDLLGVEPVWNNRGIVDNLRLVPDADLKRPRVDVLVTVSGIYRDGFPDKVMLLDRAVRLAATAGQSAVTRNDAAVKAALIAAGVDAGRANTIAQSRVFGNRPGSYGIGVQRMVEQSADAGRPDDLAALFLHNMNYAFSEKAWGETAPAALASHLKNNDAVLFSRSGNLYGALDNDDTYGYVGGLNLATKSISGASPAFYIHNLRKSGAESVVDMQTWLATELNARAWNPKWLEQMQASGYAGAREMFKELEHLYGFQATSPEQLDPMFWQKSFDTYIADEHGLGMAEFFERENPHAKQWMLSRMLEVDRQGSHTYSTDDRTRLVTEYVRSVNANGVTCSANTCGNLRLHQFIGEQAASIPGLGQAELAEFGRRLGAATRWSASNFRASPTALTRGLRAGAAERPIARPPAARSTTQLPPSPTPPTIRGRVLEEKRRSLLPGNATSSTRTSMAIWAVAAALLAAGGVRRLMIA